VCFGRELPDFRPDADAVLDGEVDRARSGPTSGVEQRLRDRGVGTNGGPRWSMKRVAAHVEATREAAGGSR
jgi:hypothetical protein